MLINRREAIAALVAGGLVYADELMPSGRKIFLPARKIFTGQITFPAPTANWGHVTGIMLFDAAAQAYDGDTGELLVGHTIETVFGPTAAEEREAARYFALEPRPEPLLVEPLTFDSLGLSITIKKPPRIERLRRHMRKVSKSRL